VRLHGLVSEQACADIFDEPPLSELGITGGRLRFILDREQPVFRITTTYRVPRRLTAEEQELLVEATRTQWSDGCGSGSFENCNGTVLSTALAMAILNTDSSRTDLGEYFVDAYPMFSDEEPGVAYFDHDDDDDDFRYVQEAAGFGDAGAQYSLGRRLRDGDGVEKNERLAFENFQQAAEQGHLAALTFLGLCYQRGTGTTVDLRRAFECFQTAAKQGHEFAMHCLGACYQEGQGVELDLEEGIRWYRRGVDLGNVGCMAELGECYELGKGVPKDLEQALALYQRCVDDGFDAVKPAIKRVKKLLREGKGT
jgi:TPR repeat protein